LSGEGGFWWWAIWIVEVPLCIIALALMLSGSALFNVVPWWAAGQEKMAIFTGALVLLMAAIPTAAKFVPWIIKIPAYVLGAWLCYMLFQGAAEQISAARDSVSTGAEAKITAYNNYKKQIDDKKTEKDNYVTKLNWRIGSQESVNAAQTTFNTASTHKQTVCQQYPYGGLCKEATTAETTAQGKLDDAKQVLDWTNKVHNLEEGIPKLEAEQRALNAPMKDPQAVAASRLAAAAPWTWRPPERSCHFLDPPLCSL